MIDTKAMKFSVSSIKDYLHCGLKWKFGRLDKIKPTKEASHHRWLGRVVHTSIYQSMAKFEDSGMKSWKINRKIPSKIAALDLFDKLWVHDESTEYASAVIKSELEKKPVDFMKKRQKAELNVDDPVQRELGWRSHAETMVIAGVEALEKFDILQFERELQIEMVDHVFRGFIDVIAKDDEGKIVFLDFKTSWERPSPNQMSKDIQFVLYSIALKQIFELDYYPVGFLVHLRSGALVRFEPYPAMVDYIEKKCKNVITNIGNGLFFDDWGGILCNYCDFYNECKARR